MRIIFLLICVLSVSCKQPDPIPKIVSLDDPLIHPMDHPRKSTRMVTVQHDGHWFLVLGENFMHHVDCPCKKTKTKEF